MLGCYEPAWGKAWASSSTLSPTSCTKEPTERKTTCMGWMRVIVCRDQIPGMLWHACRDPHRHIRVPRLITVILQTALTRSS